MNDLDIRWEQRFANYNKALDQLNRAIDLSRSRNLSELEQQGLIQAFEFTHELAWNVVKDYFEYQGNTSITGSRDATREAFNKGLIADGDGWMEMIKSRNKSSHTYNQETADEIVKNICDIYADLFNDFEQKMKTLQKS
jgi:nucleotidyltransferase substrate binding protein (TIGR01987 family)